MSDSRIINNSFPSTVISVPAYFPYKTVSPTLTVIGSSFLPVPTAKEKPQKGKIVAVGTGKKDEPMTVKVGDTVLYGKYAGTEITVDGKELLIMRESDIFAVI